MGIIANKSVTTPENLSKLDDLRKVDKIITQFNADL